MATIIKPPASLPDGFSIFLAGSIELGSAGNWQRFLEEKLSGTDVILFNPRRDDWDSSWIQSKTDPKFREQVEWELEAMERANLIAMYFEPATKSPVSLLELGLFARSGKVLVCCPEGFWRKGNVDMVCARYGVKQVEALNDLAESILRFVNQNGMASC
jgi:hypothetical protein